MAAEAGKGARPFTRAEFESGEKKLLRDGHSANARVFLFSWKGEQWSVKDFSTRSWFVRRVVAPFLFWRELKAVASLGSVAQDIGVPHKAFRVDRDAVAVSFLPGESLGSALQKDPDGTVTMELLEDMEKLMDAIHEAGIVHLDARGTGNWVLMPNGKPGLIDFQAALGTRLMPVFARKILEDIDMTGVLKKWDKYFPDEMGEERLRRYARGNRYRSKWVFKGYFWKGKKAHRRYAAKRGGTPKSR